MRVQSVLHPANLLRYLGGLRYERSADGGGKRDLRLDLLRGFCVFVMIVDHVGGETSWLYALTGGDRFFVSAAEGFVLLSGISMGLAHRSVITRQGLRAMAEKVAGRAWLLYSLTVALTIAFAAVSVVVATPWAAWATPASDAGDFVISVVTLRRTYSFTDVLFLYTLLVLAAAPALWLLSRGRTSLVLALSWLAWATVQLIPDRLPEPWPVIDGGFPFTAWQVIFFSGLAIGYHRSRISPYLRPSALLAIGAAAVVGLVAVVVIAESGPGGASADVRELLFDKNGVRPGRIIALVGAASILYAGVTLAWAPVRRALGGMLLPIGRQALFAYAMHLFVVAFLASALMAPVRLDRENSIFQTVAVALVWLACRIQSPAASQVSAAARGLRRSLASGPALLRPASIALAGVIATGCVLATPSLKPIVSAATEDAVVSIAQTSGPRTFSAHGTTVAGTFRSKALGRQMPYTVFLPPDYAADPMTRYPTIYLLHGGSGTNREWIDYGVLAEADRLMMAGTLAPAIIVLPQGDQEYWVDHIVSRVDDGAKWGTYTALEVVPEIDRRFRTIDDASARAIGGLSMGGHGAIQLAMTFPGIWSVIGAHSPSIRPPGDAPTYLGTGQAYAARDPLSLIAAKPDLARRYAWWIDTGAVDPWRDATAQVAAKLASLDIAHSWHLFAGDHSAAYWRAHVGGYLAYYSEALGEGLTRLSQGRP